jgi:hypothetical protein
LVVDVPTLAEVGLKLVVETPDELAGAPEVGVDGPVEEAVTTEAGGAVVELVEVVESVGMPFVVVGRVLG